MPFEQQTVGLNATLRELGADATLDTRIAQSTELEKYLGERRSSQNGRKCVQQGPRILYRIVEAAERRSFVHQRRRWTNIRRVCRSFVACISVWHPQNSFGVSCFFARPNVKTVRQQIIHCCQPGCTHISKPRDLNGRGLTGENQESI